MQKLHEIFKVLNIQKMIVFTETIRGNTVFIEKIMILTTHIDSMHWWFHAQLVQKILNGLYFLLPFKVKEGLSEFLEQDGRSIKVRILWELNYLLFQATFNGYDEVARFHNVQMR